MIRAAAKNHKDVLIVVLEYLKGGQNDQQFRSKLAWKAFQHVAAYDSAVSEWLWKQAEGLTAEKKGTTMNYRMNSIMNIPYNLIT
uniref:Uncharacterized protein n=1 Tax=Brassica oleracea var. oleracea TaxID=109376 RepID=A0A0D3ECP8_BRAOL